MVRDTCVGAVGAAGLSKEQDATIPAEVANALGDPS
jgi:uncharacterized protein GlcG (DUF336 family)